MIISVDHYFYNLKKDKLTEEEQAQNYEFENYIYTLMEYENYLTNDIKTFYDNYINHITSLSFVDQGETKENLNIIEKNAINKYYSFLDSIRSKQIAYQKKLVPQNNNVSLGYANAFIILLSTIASGIIVALTMFFMIK